MILKRLTLTNFKNIEEANLAFSPKINCFLGDNGMGKSNLLDALYFLSLCRSFTGANDSLLVRRGAEYASVKANYLRRDLDEEVTAALRPGHKKVLKRGGKAYKRLAEHLGLFPSVLLSPADMELAAGEPAERRRFIDQIIAQGDTSYFDALVRYNSLLDQRNKLLKEEIEDDALFEVLEAQLEIAAEKIVRARIDNIRRLQEIFTPYYRAISGNDEDARIEYVHSDYSASGGLAAHMAATRLRDRALKHTASGPHRDDIAFSIDGMPVRRSASQGQTKTFTTALRFSQYELLREALGIRPLLLLDDIFDKLDAGRVERIIALVGQSGSFGQIFITDTNRRHLDETIAAIGKGGDYGIWQVEHGNFSPITACDAQNLSD